MNIYVGNIAFSMTDDELKQAFEAFGEVSRATILKEKCLIDLVVLVL